MTRHVKFYKYNFVINHGNKFSSEGGIDCIITRYYLKLGRSSLMLVSWKE